MTEQELAKIKAALLKTLELLEPFQESGWLGSEALNLHKEALEILENTRPTDPRTAEALEALDAIEDCAQDESWGSLNLPKYIETIRAALQASACPQHQRSALEEIREIYANMDGFISETAGEGYLQMIIKQMYDTAIEGLAAPQASAWQPIETAPRDGRKMIMRPTSGYWSDDVLAWVSFSEYRDCEVILKPQPTHWMPHPQPPEDKE